jgi:5-methylcytosine-specific restriction endonuclease McrA
LWGGEELHAAGVFHTIGLAMMPKCAVCGGPSTEVHHVIDAQVLRDLNRTRARAGEPLIDVYDLLNALGLCERCHSRHTNAVERIPRRRLRPSNFAFAKAIGQEWRIDRFYPETGGA